MPSARARHQGGEGTLQESAADGGKHEHPLQGPTLVVQSTPGRPCMQPEKHLCTLYAQGLVR